jgi:hypothetical protein
MSNVPECIGAGMSRVVEVAIFQDETDIDEQHSEAQ